MRPERLGGNAVSFSDQAKEDVLGTDEAVVQQAGFFLGKHQHSPRPVGEAFEHSSEGSCTLARLPHLIAAGSTPRA